jgi:hypothetical protein
MPTTMKIMEQELPLLVYTYQLNSVVDLKEGCEVFYVNQFGFNEEIAQSLCTDENVKTFSFQDQLKTNKAWMNIYINNNTYVPDNYADLVFLTGLSYKDLNALIFASTSKFD